MEITKREAKILEFIKKFKYCKIEHIEAFVDNTKAVKKRIEHLFWAKEITIDKDAITTEKNIDEEEKENMLKVLDVIAEYKKKEKIIDIEKMDMPYYACAKTKNQEYVYFTIITKGREKIELKLIDNFNRGNTIIILEELEQVKHLDILTTPVAKIIVYKKFLKDRQI